MITSWDVVQIDAWSFRGTASSDLSSPTFYFYLDGRLLAVSDVPIREITLAPGQMARFEVFDSAEDLPSEAHPSRAVITWESVVGASRYRVELYVEEEWQTRATVEAGQPLRYETDTLLDDVVEVGRIVAVGANDGAAREIVTHCVRRPDAPAVSLSYAGGDVTVEAAA